MLFKKIFLFRDINNFGKAKTQGEFQREARRGEIIGMCKAGSSRGAISRISRLNSRKSLLKQYNVTISVNLTHLNKKNILIFLKNDISLLSYLKLIN